MTQLTKNWNQNSVYTALIGASYFFLIMCATYMLKPLRDSSFLTEFHPNAKPLFNLVTMVLLFVVATVYSKCIDKFRGFNLIKVFFTVIISNLLIIWLAFYYLPMITGAVFYGWLSCANVFLVTVFWTQINSSFTGKKDKIYYILIGLGGGLGATFGGKITSMLVPVLGTNNLIGAAIIFLLVAFFLSKHLSKLNGKDVFNVTSQSFKTQTDGVKALLKERYAICIFALVVIGTFVQSIYDYQLTTLVASTIEHGKDSYSIFYGGLYYKLNMFSILAQILIGPLVLLSLGPARGLFIVPLLILGTALAITLNQSLIVMEWVFIVFAGSAYSVVQMLREQLYVPASHAIKVRGKGFIDTFGFRAGDSLAAVSFVVLISILGIDIVGLDYLVIISGLIAAYFLVQANRIYKRLNDSTSQS